MKYFGQFLLFLVAVAVLIGLQYQYWLGENGHADSKDLQTEIEAQLIKNKEQEHQNQILRADVRDLKTGLEAVEEHARVDLGLIKPHETFVQLSTAPNTHTSIVAPDIDPDDAIESIP
ncbi:septum formation initiator family protein [Psychrobacter sp. I-STPA6b]|uniref:septum formation initiator family protein n=1 Tax=Psychrobacter sp. I-STPA6b TaxID=2585718 RepID=UPI001D0C0C45|nr:septum formation initiator family protein [Psychrobacter sp. I-STPA6b]